jgi:hypothetical protein
MSKPYEPMHELDEATLASWPGASDDRPTFGPRLAPSIDARLRLLNTSTHILQDDNGIQCSFRRTAPDTIKVTVRNLAGSRTDRMPAAQARRMWRRLLATGFRTW